MARRHGTRRPRQPRPRRGGDRRRHGRPQSRAARSRQRRHPVALTPRRHGARRPAAGRGPAVRRDGVAAAGADLCRPTARRATPVARAHGQRGSPAHLRRRGALRGHRRRARAPCRTGTRADDVADARQRRRARRPRHHARRPGRRDDDRHVVSPRPSIGQRALAPRARGNGARHAGDRWTPRLCRHNQRPRRRRRPHVLDHRVGPRRGRCRLRHTCARG